MHAMRTTKNATSLIATIHTEIIARVVQEVIRITVKIGMAVAIRAKNVVDVMRITATTMNTAAITMSIMNRVAGIPLLIYMYALGITEASLMEAFRFPSV